MKAHLICAILTLIFAVNGCRLQILTPPEDPAQLSPSGQLTLSPSSAVVAAMSEQSVTFQIDGGTPPFVYAIESGPGSIDAQTGIFTAGTFAGETVISVTDAKGIKKLSTIVHQSMITDGDIKDIQADLNGNLYLAGSFTKLYPSVATNFMALRANGSIDPLSTFSSVGFSGGQVLTIVPLPEGGWIVGGNFTHYRGKTANGIAKLDANGVLDEIFSPQEGAPNGFNGAVKSIAIYGSGVGTKYYVGGVFGQYRNLVANAVAKLDVNGVLDEVFSPQGGQPNGFNGPLEAVAVGDWGDGPKLYVAGQTDIYRDLTGFLTPQLTRIGLDGQPLDDFYGGWILASGNPWVGIQHIWVMGEGENAHLYVAGYMDDPKVGIMRFDPDGNLDGDYLEVLNGRVNSVSVVGTGDSAHAYIGGTFTTVGGSPANRIARLNGLGNLDTTFSPVAGSNGFDAEVKIISARSLGGGNEQIFVTGSFGNYRGTQTSTLAVLNQSGILDGAFRGGGFGTGNVIDAIAMSGLGENSRFLVMGTLTMYGGYRAEGLAKMNAQGVPDPVFHPAQGRTGFNGSTHAIALDPSGALYVGGEFTTYQGAPAPKIAKLSATGELDVTFNPPAGPNGANGTVLAIALNSTGALFVGGDFTSYRGQPSNYLAKVSATGTLDADFITDGVNNGFNGFVTSILAQSDSEVFVGGAFSTYQAQVARGIAKLNENGELDLVFNPQAGDNGVMGMIKKISKTPTGEIAFIGNFNFYRDAIVFNIGKVLSNGTLAPGFAPNEGAIFDGDLNSLFVSDDGDCYVGGAFQNYAGAPANRIAKINSAGVLDQTFNPPAGSNGVADGALQSILVRGSGDDTRIYFGGAFSLYRDTLSAKNFGVVNLRGLPAL